MDKMRKHIKHKSLINTEILYNLSSSTNITDSLKKFGGQDDDESFVVVSFESDIKELIKVFDGEWVDMNQLQQHIDKELLKKIHKLKLEELDDLTGSLCSRISGKDSM